METPPPVNLSAMNALLAKAKMVMAKVDEAKPIVLSETTQKQIAAEKAEEKNVNPASLQPRSPAGYTREQVMASKFPQAVKEAMIKSIPLQQIILEDKSDLDDVVMTPNKRNPILKENKTNIISNNSDMITISKTELKSMINESLAQFFKTSYDKKLTEDAITRTIQMLIKEGKITSKQK